jgi:hypothetical protein
MYKLAQLYLLPSKDEDGYSIKKGIKNGHTYMQWDNLGECPYGFYNPYHLYFTSDDVIEGGDWYINTETKILWQCTNDKAEIMACNELSNARKIIATTDNNLSIECNMCASEEITRAYTCKCKSTPKPSRAFLNGYCRKQGEIGDVMVEYEVTNRCCGRCDGVHDLCFADMTCDDHNEMGCPKCYGPRGDEIKLKLNSDKEIIIEPARNKWNRKELDVILSNLTNEVYNTFRNKKHATFDLENWKNVNLK